MIILNASADQKSNIRNWRKEICSLNEFIRLGCMSTQWVESDWVRLQVIRGCPLVMDPLPYRLNFETSLESRTNWDRFVRVARPKTKFKRNWFEASLLKRVAFFTNRQFDLSIQSDWLTCPIKFANQISRAFFKPVERKKVCEAQLEATIRSNRMQLKFSFSLKTFKWNGSINKSVKR